MPNNSPTPTVPITDNMENDDDGVTVTANEDDYKLLESGDGAEANNEPGQHSPLPSTTLRTNLHSPIPFRPIPRTLHSHISKINVYIHTTHNPALSKVASLEHACAQTFFNHRQRLEDIIEKARLCILQQEPYFTLINAGYNLYLRDPQVSYKVLAIDDNFLIDFVVDVKAMTYNKAQLPLPEPFYETKGDTLWSQTDVSFKFKVHNLEIPTRPQTRTTATMTYDAAFLSPLIDNMRTSAEAWTASINQSGLPISTTSNDKPIKKMTQLPKLDDDVPPRHHLASTSSGSSDGHLLRERLGPPVGRSFATRLPVHESSPARKRSRSNDRYKKRSRK